MQEASYNLCPIGANAPKNVENIFYTLAPGILSLTQLLHPNQKRTPLVDTFTLNTFNIDVFSQNEIDHLLISHPCLGQTILNQRLINTDQVLHNHTTYSIYTPEIISILNLQMTALHSALNVLLIQSAYTDSALFTRAKATLSNHLSNEIARKKNAPLKNLPKIWGKFDSRRQISNIYSCDLANNTLQQYTIYTPEHPYDNNRNLSELIWQFDNQANLTGGVDKYTLKGGQINRSEYIQDASTKRAIEIQHPELYVDDLLNVLYMVGEV